MTWFSIIYSYLGTQGTWVLERWVVQERHNLWVIRKFCLPLKINALAFWFIYQPLKVWLLWIISDFWMSQSSPDCKTEDQRLYCDDPFSPFSPSLLPHQMLWLCEAQLETASLVSYIAKIIHKNKWALAEKRIRGRWHLEWHRESGHGRFMHIVGEASESLFLLLRKWNIHSGLASHKEIGSKA